MRLSDLIGAEACDTDGERLGRVCEVFAKAGEVDALGIGMHTLLARLLSHRRGRRIPWSKVKRVEKGKIVVRA